MGKIVIAILILIFMVLSTVSCMYFLFAGIWRYNPIDIPYLNTKGFISSAILFIFALIVAKVFNELTE